MSRNLTKEELIIHKNNALNALDSYLQSMINSSDKRINGKADKLSYWLKHWTKFLNFENQFLPSSLKKYKRGEIIKVHLGYNIGSEEGGLHYAVVVEKDNSIHNPVITVVPLTSVKPNKDLSCLRSGEVILGNELFIKFTAKFKELYNIAKSKNEDVQKKIDKIRDNAHISPSDVKDAEEQQRMVKERLDLLYKMRDEIAKMKKGSIALVNQITTVSKIRIYDPKTTKDMLSGITLSNDGLDKIDKEIILKFTK